MSDETTSSAQQPEVDPKRLEKYSEMLMACSDASADRRGFQDLMELAVRGSGGESRHMKTLEAGFSMLRRLRREEGEKQAAFNATFSAEEQARLNQHHRPR